MGKTAIAEGLARAIVTRTNADGSALPAFLAGKRVMQLDVGLLIAGGQGGAGGGAGVEEERGQCSHGRTQLLRRCWGRPRGGLGKTSRAIADAWPPPPAAWLPAGARRAGAARDQAAAGVQSEGNIILMIDEVRREGGEPSGAAYAWPNPAWQCGRAWCRCPRATRGYRGGWERHSLTTLGPLCSPQVHTLVGAGAVGRGGGGGGGLDISNLLKPALARGELQCIGATTLDEHRKHIERDAALERCRRRQGCGAGLPAGSGAVRPGELCSTPPACLSIPAHGCLALPPAAPEAQPAGSPAPCPPAPARPLPRRRAGASSPCLWMSPARWRRWRSWRACRTGTSVTTAWCTAATRWRPPSRCPPLHHRPLPARQGHRPAG